MIPTTRLTTRYRERFGNFVSRLRVKRELEVRVGVDSREDLVKG